MTPAGVTVERLLGDVERVTESGCWIWMGHLNAYGYGRYITYKNSRQRTFLAHRLVFEALRAPIPVGLELVAWSDGSRRCRSCLSRWRRERRLAKARGGTCQNCTAPAESGRSRCARHTKAGREAQSRLRARRLRGGA